MSSWGNQDGAYDAPLWAAGSVNKAPTQDNANTLYENTTANAYFKGATVGLYAVDANEAIVQSAQGNDTVHTGWVLRTEGTGGRAGRVQQEVLVALAEVVTDNTADDSKYPNAIITISQPNALSTVNALTANTIVLSVAGTTVVPAAATLTYQWQVNNNAGGSWVNITNGTNVPAGTGQPGGTIKSGANTATLTLDPTDTTANNYLFRAVITATNAGVDYSTAVAYSANARILVTT